MTESTHGSTLYDLGNEHTYRTLRANAHLVTDAPEIQTDWTDGGMTLIGIIEHHQDPNGKPCSATFSFVPHPSGAPSPIWTVEGKDPITVTEELECERCGDKGHITAGEWVPA